MTLSGAGIRHVGIGAMLAGLFAPAAASAQMPAWEDRGYISVSFGAQTKARTQTVRESFVLYDETATFEAPIGVGNSRLFDIGGGWKVRGNLGIGVAFSSYSDSTSAVVSARIPDPVFFDRLTSSSVTLSDMEHKERVVHASLVYVMPMNDRVEIMLLGGPSFFRLSKDLVGGVTVPTGGTTITAATRSSFSGGSVGLHVGVDLSYILFRAAPGKPAVGAGLFVRFSGASVDAEEVVGGKIDLGGLNYGLGLRLRF